MKLYAPFSPIFKTKSLPFLLIKLSLLGKFYYKKNWVILTLLCNRHSLGGAQALLAGMDLYQRDSRLSSKNLSIFTVGTPRTGNAEFAYYVDSTGIPFSRSVNERDSKLSMIIR